MYLSGQGIRTRGPRGERIVDESFLLILHAGDDDTTFRLPGPPWAESYVAELDTAAPDERLRDLKAGEDLALIARSAALLRAQ